MAETMGQIIKRLRKERNLTQEELAEQLNISSQAVSKWENETSMPDISQVVPLSNFFGVPTDVLFGVYGADNSDEIYKRLNEIFHIHDHCPDGEEGPTAIIILDKYREAIRLFPNNSTILINAMSFAETVIRLYEEKIKDEIGEEGYEALTEESIRWANLVIKYSSSIDDILSAKNHLIELNIKKGKWNDAYELADTLPRHIYYTRNIRMVALKCEAGEKEDERKLRCNNIEEIANCLETEAAMLGNLYMDEEKYEDAIYCYSFLRDMLDAMYREEKYRPPFMLDEFSLYRFPAYCHIKIGQYDKAVELLEKGVDFMITQAKYYNKKTELDIPLLRDCTFSYGYDGKAEYRDLSRKLKSFIGGEEFAPVFDDPSYQKLLKKIEKIV